MRKLAVQQDQIIAALFNIIKSVFAVFASINQITRVLHWYSREYLSAWSSSISSILMVTPRSLYVRSIVSQISLFISL